MDLRKKLNIRTRVAKQSTLFFLLICFILSTQLFAKPVSVEQVRKVVDTFLRAQVIRQEKQLRVLSMKATEQAPPKEFTTAGVKEIWGDNGKLLAYVTELEPEGFIITAADSDIRPILGYSFKGSFPLEDSKDNVLLHLVQWDMKARLKNLSSGTPEIATLAQSNNELWEQNDCTGESSFETLGSGSPWGQLIATDWDQGYAYGEDQTHYNDKCPLISPGDTDRCRVGCVATAMGQIINYWAYPPSASFSGLPWPIGDSYTSKGTIGKNPDGSDRIVPIDIDGDALDYDFPTFSQLNSALATINYDSDPCEEAYLCFAAGIKLEMGYGSGSGTNTYKVAAALRNGFDYGAASCRVWPWGLWSSYRSKVIDNIKKGWPVQIGAKDTEEKAGHSIIIDGYKSSGEFHLNLGWYGASTDTWYNLPPINAGGYSFDVIHTVVYNICPYQGWNQWGADERNSFGTIYTYPAEEPDVKWEVTAPFSRYTFDYAVVGTGNKIYAALSPCDLGQGNHPYICVIGQYGDVSDMKKIPINDSDYDIDYLTQNHRGEVFFGTSEYQNKTTVYRVDPKTENVTAILNHTSPDRGIFDQPIKVDSDDYLYFIIEPTSTSNGTKFYSTDRTGYVRWSHTFSSGMKFIHSVAAIDEERNQVYLSYYNDSLDKSYLACFDRTFGYVKWTYPFPGTHAEWEMAGTPAVSEDGTIYVGCYTTLYAINPSGVKIHERSFHPAYTHNTPAIGRNGTLYVNYGRLISGNWRPGWVWALNPDLTLKWPSAVDIGLGSSDSMDDIYSAGNEMVGFTYSRNGSGYIGGVRDNGASGSILWTSDRGTGKMIFGPGQTIYTVESTCTGTSSIHALSIGDRWDPDGLGMGFTDNAAPNMPFGPYPVDGANDVNSTVTLSWNCTDPEMHSLKYSLFVGESGYDMVPVDTNITSTSYELTGLKPGTGYAWKIIATDGQAVSEGPTWVFATNPPNPDLNGDYFVNFVDFAILADSWLENCSEPNWCEGADLDWSGEVNLPDLQILTNSWLDYIWFTYNGHHYALTLGSGTWEQAEAEATAIGAHLVTINNEEENSWLFSTFYSGDYLWIGFYQLPGSPEPAGGWIWISGEPVTYIGWDGQEPNNQPPCEDYAVLRADGGWNDWGPEKYDFYPIRGIIEVP